MVQIYFLTICLNILSGIILAAPYFHDRFPWASSIREYIFNISALHIVLVASLFLIGVLKIICVFQGDVIIVGDLLPALTLIVSGFTLLIEYIAKDSEIENGFLKKMVSIFVERSSIVGVIAVVSGSLHFVFPGVLFL
jgi:hypothetical protein